MSIEQENNDMLRNQIKEVTHHSQEIKGVVNKRTRVEPWVVAKMERAATDLSDVTHYLDGERYEDGGSMYGGGGSTYQIQIENKTDDDNYQIELEKIKLISKKSDFDLVKGFIEEDKFFLSFWKNQNRLFTISGTWYDESGMEATFTKESDGQQVQFDWHPFNSMGGFNKEQFIENLNKALKELNVLNTSNKKSSVSRKKSSVKQITKSEIKEIVDKVGNVQIWSDGKYYVIHKSFTGKKYYLTIDGAMAGRDEYFGSATLKLPDTLNYTEIKFSDLSPVIAAERFNDKSLAKYSDGGSMYADGGGLYDYKIGDYAWIRKADYNEYYGEIIDIRNLEMNLDLGKGVKGTQNEIYATIIDENGKEQSGELLPKNYADGGSTYADGGEIKVGDQFVNTERGEKFYIEKIDTSDKSFPFYVLKSKPTDFPEVIGKNEFERYYKAGLYKKMAHGSSTYADGGSVKKIGSVDEPDGIMYEFEVNQIAPQFYHSLVGHIDKYDDNEYYATYENTLYDYDLQEKTFSTFEEAEKWVLSKINSEKDRYMTEYGNKMSDGGNIFKNEKYNITYEVRPSASRSDRWEVVESSPKWEEENIMTFVSEEDALDYAKISSGVKKESDPESMFMRRTERFDDGGEIGIGMMAWRGREAYNVIGYDDSMDRWVFQSTISGMQYLPKDEELKEFEFIKPNKMANGGSKYGDGGNAEKIAKLEKYVLTSTFVPESMKEKARMEIERLKSESSESTSGLSAEQRDFNKKVLSIIDRENISQPNQFEEIISEALQDANFHTEAYKFAKLSDPTIQSKEDWYQSKRFTGDDLTTQLGIEIANKAGWNGNYISEAMQFVLRMKGYQKIADALKGAMEEEDRYPNRIESTTEKQNFFIKEIATRTATDQRAVTEFVKDNGLTESETLNIVQGLGMGKIKPMDFVTALMGNVEFENNIVSFAKSNEAFKTPEQKPSIRTAVEPKTKSIRTAVVETKVETPMETAVETKQPEIKDARLKGKKISDVSTYIAHWNIDSITFTLDGKTYTVKGSDIFDGVYVENKAIGVKAKRTTKAKQPKVTRTQFEEEEFEFGKGGKA